MASEERQTDQSDDIFAAFVELRHRLVGARQTLEKRATEVVVAGLGPEGDRLKAKANGIGVAISYVEEEIRTRRQAKLDSIVFPPIGPFQ